MSVELILNKEKEISDLENRIIELKKELEILKSEKSPKKSIIDMTGDDKVNYSLPSLEGEMMFMQ
jgi:hypothetical protein